MNNLEFNIKLPKGLAEIIEESARLYFSMQSDLRTGAFLRLLASSRIRGNILELGTGTGYSA